MDFEKNIGWVISIFLIASIALFIIFIIGLKKIDDKYANYSLHNFHTVRQN